ncbi:DUF1294 domain-containing protein [Lacimicrobium alkaliphilum]|uniref:DNA-binding protein n=1 Tax=Lacimicrobium alkaliphilum TaxID=1526571 RepID=A0ABQ1RLK9_9ALTE|nr:cold shock and DUF1294 domain-containing protein [Lacimicrobium alkaliphilum]GGD74638.1 DNA-binding protein [Lacimicrobium alkaliphilum]
MRFQGKLTNWNDDKGFGFVEPNGGGDRSFVHIKSFQKRSRRPAEGDLIIYEQVKEPQGKFKAINVSLVADRKVRPEPPKKSANPGALIVVTFSVILTATVLLKYLPPEVLYLYIATSTIAFIFYAFDKSAAKNGRWRTPESHLHFLSLVGGWPGAFYAQKSLRHKSSKTEFKRVYWATVMMNIFAFVWLFTGQGRHFLLAIVG